MNPFLASFSLLNIYSFQELILCCAIMVETFSPPPLYIVFFKCVGCCLGCELISLVLILEMFYFIHGFRKKALVDI